MKVAIIGSRGITSPVDPFIPEGTTEIITGGAKGVDTQAYIYARQHNIPVRIFKPDYKQHGQAATHIRNRQIVDAADQVVAVWDGNSTGTESTINYARREGKPCQIHTPSTSGTTSTD